jgi:dolichol-phosphate mannosyltransferase
VKHQEVASITTIVPVYNEATGVAAALEQIHAAVKQRFTDQEMLIVESGSTDNSAAICDEVAAQLDGVRVLHQDTRLGFGSALRLGFEQATRDLVWVVSSDLPFPLDVLDTALPLVQDHDCVLSYRSNDDRKLFRRTQSLAYNSLARSTLGLRNTHVNSQFKLYRRQVIQALHIDSEGWFIDTEIIYRLQTEGYRCAEIPVPLTERTTGESTLAVSQPLTSLRELLTFAWMERNAK